MKAGVENGHLRNIAPKFLHKLHALQLGANVQRRKTQETLSMAERTSGVMTTGSCKMRPTMDHTVSHDIDLRSGSNGNAPSHHAALRSKWRITCSREETGISSFRTTPCEFFSPYYAAVSTLHSILPSHRGGGRIRRKSGSNFVQAGLLADGTRVEHEYFHRCL